MKGKSELACEQALCFGKKNSKESSPLDQRPVHRLNQSTLITRVRIKFKSERAITYVTIKDKSERAKH